MNKKAGNNKEILIVGAGPTGLMLGCQLLQAGISCRLIEKRQERSQATRAIGVTASTLQLFKTLECYDALLKDAVLTDKIKVFWDKKPLFSLKSKQSSMSSFVYCTQPSVEKLLEEKFKRLGGNVERGFTLDSVQNFQTYNKVTLVKDDNVFNEYYDYVIGCDGGQSLVQQSMKVRYARKDYKAYFCVADVELASADFNQHACYFLTPMGYCMLIPMPKSHNRLIFSLRGEYPTDFHQKFDIPDFEKIVKERSGNDITIKNIIWKASGPFRHQVVLTAVNQRLILAGDALHLFSPIGGTNMNVGLLDANALAKTFIQIYTGTQPDVALERYAENRQKVLQENMRNTQLATYAITQSKQRNREYEQQFLPSRQNIHFIRNVLPQQFSLEGYY